MSESLLASNQDHIKYTDKERRKTMRARRWMTGILAIALIIGLMAVPARAVKESIKIGAINVANRM